MIQLFLQKLVSIQKRQFYNLTVQHFLCLQTLFDPLNPDKETITSRQWNRRERLDNEFWLIQKLGGIMEKANFYAIPKTTVTKALAEHSTAEGLIVGHHIFHFLLKYFSEKMFPSL